ncbi:major facilitator superfamily transporter [Apiospora kogelbergensis]|uniref:Major facilitator superfamily transporter n=1 Tax=Apiospora kogelbergensis TaxID=1337665 RepID=A0AAW0R6I9_9PEZI
MAAPVPFRKPHHGVPVDEKMNPALDLEAASISEGKPGVNALHVERAELLANLPDPDADKTPEERAAIVREPIPHPPC